MEKHKTAVSVFEKYLTVWVILCMAVGVLVEVPVTLVLARIANNTKRWFPQGVAK